MVAAIGGAVVSAPAQAGIVAQAQSVAVKRPGLTAADRDAITIRSVTAASDPSLGLIVTVDFAGDVERYVGQGALKNALLALVLEPGTVTQTPSGLAAQGGGFTPAAFSMLVRHGKRETIRRASVDVFSTEHVLRTFSGGQYGVIRDGDQVVFRIAGPALANVAGIKVKAFVKSPVRFSTTGPTLTSVGWRAVVNTRPASVSSLNLSPSLLSSAQLATVGSGVSSLLSASVQPELRAEQKVHTQLKTALDDYATIQTLARGHRGLPIVSSGTLVSELGNAGARISRLRNEVAALNGLSGNIATLSTAGVQVVQTDTGFSQELSTQPGRPISTLVPQGLPVINVNPQVRYQQFTGVGAALTDSSAWLIYDELSPTSRLALLQALFGEPGTANSLGLPAIHLNFLRIGIGAPGAMTVGAPYSYDDNPPGGSDPTLSDFSIAHDLSYIIPTLQQALSINPALEVFANPWSPPAWMKTESTLDNPDGQNTLDGGDYETFANYIVKFIQDYEAQGVPITAIAPQNEPSSGQGGATNYPGMEFPATNEGQFIADDLAPALQAAGLSTKIYGNDLSWSSSSYASALASGPAAGDLAGISWHCYFGSPTAMTQQHAATPGLDQLVDECSPEIRGFGTPEFLISSLRNWASAVSVWSVALDPNDGPIQAGNSCPGCTGPVTINEATQAVILRPEYYQLGQVSDFVQPGATRIDSPSTVTYGLNGSNVETVTAGLDDVAFQNPDGSYVLVVYNNNTAAPITFASDEGGSYFTYSLPNNA
ncbi:MAG: glycoside hydrolase family 30 protein, partial [Solirubrobacteraceae bacterium]